MVNWCLKYFLAHYREWMNEGWMNEWRGHCLSPSLTLYSMRPDCSYSNASIYHRNGGGVLFGMNKWMNEWVTSNSQFSNSLFTSSFLFQSAKCLDLITREIFKFSGNLTDDCYSSRILSTQDSDLDQGLANFYKGPDST